MPVTLIFCTILGLLSYWIVKVPATINGSTPINTVRDFFGENWKQIALSIIGVTLVCVGGNEIPESWGKITGPFPAFILGGSMPSIIMNTTDLFKK